MCVCGGVTLRLACGGLGPHVRELSLCFPASTAFHPVSMVSPLKADVFARELLNHPDQTKVSSVLNGLRNGVKLVLGGSSPPKGTNHL